MRKRVVAAALGAAALALWMAVALSAAKKVYPKRWVYVSRSLRDDRDVDAIRGIVETAAAHGLNGMVLAGGLDSVDIKPPEYFDRLRKVKETCDRNGVEIIPTGFNVGYGGALLSHDRELAEGMPVKGALFVAEGNEARFQQENPPKLEKASAVLTLDGAARLEQKVRLTPYRSYRIHARVRAEGAAPRTQIGIRAVAPDGRNLNYFQSDIASDASWREVDSGFNSWYADAVDLSIGAGRGRGGKLHIADLRLEEVGLVNVIRRPGTPVHVRNDRTGTEYEEGRDFERIEDPKRNYRFDHESPAVRLTANSRIKTGDRLRVDYFHGVTIYRGQTPACISEPRVMPIWRKQFPILERELAPKTYLLALDEVRMGGTCEDCRRRTRTMSMAQILGAYATELREMIRATNPKAEVFVWSDMFDPNHNARDKYYLVDGDYTGSWNYLPKDIQIAAWYYQRRDLSLKHFSGLGFKTLAGAYYDADDLENPKGWLESLDATPGAVGIMYTTWQRKYGLLADFGDLVSKR
jgi:hypothetical protein